MRVIFNPGVLVEQTRGVLRRCANALLMRPRLATLLLAQLLLSLVGFAAPWLAVFTDGRIAYDFTAVIAIVTLILSIATTGCAIFIHRKRGLWVALAALPALLWPAFTISLMVLCSMYGDCD